MPAPVSLKLQLMRIKPKPYRSDIQRHRDTIAYSLACISAGFFVLAIVGIILLPVIWFVLRNVILLKP